MTSSSELDISNAPEVVLAGEHRFFIVVRLPLGERVRNMLAKGHLRPRDEEAERLLEQSGELTKIKAARERLKHTTRQSRRRPR